MYRSHPVSGFIRGKEKRPKRMYAWLSTAYLDFCGEEKRRECAVFLVFVPGCTYVLKAGKNWCTNEVPLMMEWWDLQLECNNETKVKTHSAISKLAELNKVHEFWLEARRPLQSHESRLRLRGHFSCPFHLSVANGAVCHPFRVHNSSINIHIEWMMFVKFFNTSSHSEKPENGNFSYYNLRLEWPENILGKRRSWLCCVGVGLTRIDRLSALRHQSFLIILREFVMSFFRKV
jgi:hypothetical protein